MQKKDLRENSIILFVDCHPNLLRQSQTTPFNALKTNLANLFELAHYFNIPHLLLSVPQPIESRDLITELRDVKSEKNTIFRTKVDPFLVPEIKKQLKLFNRKKLIVVGCSVEVGIFFSTSSAIEQGYEVLIPVDAVAGHAERTQTAVLSELHKQGAKLTSTRSLIAQCEDDFASTNGQFILSLLKKVVSF